MDRRRLALVRAGEDTGFRRIGSGYLVAPRLVLTARHVVETAGSSWPRLDVRVGHPQDDTHRCGAQVCWTHPDGRDVALLLLDDPIEVPGAVRWGDPAGTDPLPYDALGFPSATTRDGQHSVEHLRGELPPLGGGRGDQDRYVLDQGHAPDGAKAWAGASGSAVFCRDRLVGVVIHDDEAFANRRLHACPSRSFAGDPGFADLLERHGGGRPRLSQVGTDLGRYLRAARLAAAEHPYPGAVPGTRPPLSHIYVRQQVVPQKLPHAPSPPRPVDEVLTGDGICLVVAGPGGGKSSLLRTRLAHGVTQWLDGTDDPGPAPVLVPAAALLGAPLSRALADTVNAQLRPYGLTTPLPATFFQDRPGPGHSWLVLVDGLDEITSAEGREDVLRTVAHAGADYAFVVATRPVREVEPGIPGILGPDVPRHELEPFGTDERERVATGWLRVLGAAEPEESARRFLRGLDRVGLTGLARVPLTLSMLCQLRASPGESLPEGRRDVYHSFVNLLHERQYAAGAVEQARTAMRQYGSEAEVRAERTVQNLRPILADLAHRLLLTQHEKRPVLDIARDHECAERPEAVPERRWRDFLESVLCGTGLLIRRADDLVFIHQTFLEYFAARHVVDDEERLRTVFRETFFRPARHTPGRSLSAGVSPRLWFARYWMPPEYDPFNGFLLDLTPDDHPLKTEFLTRMASRRAGLEGYKFLINQMTSGTSLPNEVIKNCVDPLSRLARDRSLNPFGRLQAATLVIFVDVASGVELLRELAADPSMAGFGRVAAARMFAGFAPDEPARFLGDLVQETGLEGYDRTKATETATEIDPAHPRRTIADSRYQLKAALALTDIDRVAGVRRLHALARDGSLLPGARFQAVTALKWLDGGPGQAELLHFLADDATLGVGQRIGSAWMLANADPDGAARLHERFARDPEVKASDRLQAAQCLSWTDPQRAWTVLRELRDDTTLGRRHRRQAAKLLSKSRGPDQR